MGRIAEWLLAAIGAAVGVTGTGVSWQSQVLFGPGTHPWPLPGLVLLEWALFGLAGLAVVAIDSEGRPKHWGLVTWGVIGGLVPLMVLGVFSIGVFVLPIVLSFSGAAILSDRRRGRSMRVNLALSIAVALANGAAVVAI